MIRYIVTILISILAITFLRAVVGLITRTFGEMMKGAAPPQHPQQQDIPAAATLRRCQVCSTYMPENAMIRRGQGAGVAFYCSKECAAKARG